MEQGTGRRKGLWHCHFRVANPFNFCLMSLNCVPSPIPSDHGGCGPSNGRAAASGGAVSLNRSPQLVPNVRNCPKCLFKLSVAQLLWPGDGSGRVDCTSLLKTKVSAYKKGQFGRATLRFVIPGHQPVLKIIIISKLYKRKSNEFEKLVCFKLEGSSWISH